jgi:hypothetical protein
MRFRMAGMLSKSRATPHGAVSVPETKLGTRLNGKKLNLFKAFCSAA